MPAGGGQDGGAGSRLKSKRKPAEVSESRQKPAEVGGSQQKSGEVGGCGRGPQRLCWKWADDQHANSDLHVKRRRNPAKFLKHRDPKQDSAEKGEIKIWTFGPVVAPKE